MNQMGLPVVSEQIDTISREIEELENKRDEEIASTNENPWTSEALRSSKVIKVQEKYEDKINARVNRLRLMENAADDARQQAQFAATLAIDVYDKERRFNRDRLEFMIDQTQKILEAEQKARKQELRKGFELSPGQARYEFNPLTGTFEQTAALPRVSEEKERGTKTIDTGTEIQLIDDVTGEVIQSYPKTKIPGTSETGLTQYQTISLRNRLEDNLRQNPSVKAFGELVNFGVPVVLDRFEKGETDSVADTILMRSLAKVTDPTTGIREEEYRTFENAIGSLNRVFVMPQSWIGKGRLTPEGRAQMIREIQDRYDSREEDYLNQYQYYQYQAGQAGVTIPPPYSVVKGEFTGDGLTDDEAYQEYLKMIGQ